MSSYTATTICPSSRSTSQATTREDEQRPIRPHKSPNEKFPGTMMNKTVRRSGGLKYVTIIELCNFRRGCVLDIDVAQDDVEEDIFGTAVRDRVSDEADPAEKKTVLMFHKKKVLSSPEGLAIMPPCMPRVQRVWSSRVCENSIGKL
ncbi:hypothetical protein FQA39_LY03481 [Lamprigera yunnana]|nr:hypothetical protein FQA39_LY03481 [Lamprigera yunnana]